MGFTSEQRAECQNILDRLSELVETTRRKHRDKSRTILWKEELAGAEEDIHILSKAIGDVSLNLRRDRNHYAPINRLLDELLVEIWSYTDTLDRFAISHVCIRWRHIALSATMLWTTMDMEANQVKMLRRLLERSANSPLNVVVGIKRIGKGKTTLGLPIHPQSMSYYNSRSTLPDPIGSLDLEKFSKATSANMDRENMPFLTQKEFNGMIGRCVTLDAIMERSNPYYVTPKILDTAMPYLRTFRLMRGPIIITRAQLEPTAPTITAEDLPFPLFNKVVPNLRELCFEEIHARWNDPIYSNLSDLRLWNPHSRASVHQMLRMLRLCRHLTNLELTGALLPYAPLSPDHNPEDPSQPVNEKYSEDIVELPNLKYLHFECTADTCVTDFVTFLSTPRLGNLRINAAGLNTRFPTAKPSITDPTDHPFFHFLPLMSQPTYMCLSDRADYFTMEARCSNPDQHPLGSYGNEDWALVNHAADEAGYWCYVSRTSADWRYDTHSDVDTSEWMASAHFLSFGPPLTIQPSFSQRFRRMMNLKMVVLSNQIMDVLDRALQEGIQLDHIKKFQLKYSTVLPDFIYYEIFSMFRRIEKLKLSYNRGVGILSAVIGEDKLPMLSEVYLIENEVLPMVYDHPNPDILADWVELRQGKAARDAERYHQIGEAGFEDAVMGSKVIRIDEETGGRVELPKRGDPKREFVRPLSKLVVDVRLDRLVLEPQTRRRMVAALGDRGVFIWRRAPSNERKMERYWEKAIRMDTDNDTQRVSGDADLGHIVDDNAGPATAGATTGAADGDTVEAVTSDSGEDDEDEDGEDTDLEVAGVREWTLGRDIKHKWTGGPW